MTQIRRFLGTAGILSVCLLAFGCGGGGGDSAFFIPATVTETTVITSNQATRTGEGSLDVLGQPLTALAPHQSGQTGQVTALSIPANTTITPTTPFSTLPVILVSIPIDNATTAAAGLPKITPPGGTAFTVASSKGAVDISFSGTTSFTLSQPATVNIPVNAVLASPVTVYKVKANGATTVLAGTYGLDANGNKIVTVSTSDFSFLIVDPQAASGSSGGSQ